MAPEPKLAHRWAAEQERLAKLCVRDDQLDWTVYGRFVSGLRHVAGVDVSFFPDGIHAVAAVVVLSFPNLEVLYEKCATFKLDVPYICGFLAFREVPALKSMLEAVPDDVKPQVVLVDGNGVFHPRRCGSATHLGIVTGLPTIGVAKDVAKVGDVNSSAARKVAADLNGASEWAPLVGAHVEALPDDAEDGPLAVLLRPSHGKKTLVVSTGHRVSLSTAVTLVSTLCLHSIPEPIRQADLRSRAAVKAWFEGAELSLLRLSKQKAGQALLAISQGVEDLEPFSEGPQKQLEEVEPAAKRVRHTSAQRGNRRKGEHAPGNGRKKTTPVWRVKAAPADTSEGNATSVIAVDPPRPSDEMLRESEDLLHESPENDVPPHEDWTLWHALMLSLCGLCVCRK